MRNAAVRLASTILAGVAVCAGAVRAEGLETGTSALRFNGFGTLGLTHTDGPADWGFRRDISQPPNQGGTRGDTDSRLGLQVNYAATSRLELVAQVLLKRRVSEAPLIDSLEWAFASYQPAAGWTVRLGRVNPDAFLLSDYRNVGFAYLWARPEIGFYGALPLYSIDGADITRVWNLGATRWKAKLFSGEGAAYGSSMGQPGSKLIAHNISGLTLSTEWEGLTFRATAVHARLVLQNATALERLSDGLGAVRQLPLPETAAQAAELQRRLSLSPGELTFAELGIAYEGSEWLASAELSTINGSFAADHGKNGYVSLGRRFGPVTLFGMLAASRSSGSDAVAPDWGTSLAPVLGPQAAARLQQLGTGAAMAVNAQRQTQRSISFGLRWDLQPQLALKLQWDRYRIGANGHLLWANGTPDAETANVGTAVLDFIF